MIVLGITGSVANLLIMSGPAFTGSTFYYLRALSLCDMFYLVCVIGWKTLNEAEYVDRSVQVTVSRSFCWTQS